ncbi:tail fiber protein [Synechococcus phage S-8S29]|nr:tail fiber protein [Synechococcus phage S-8S29]
MADQGFLAQSKPAANTDTLLYSAPVDSSASTVLNVANDGTGAAISVGVKDFDQKLTVDASTYKLHKGDLISGYSMTLNTAFLSTTFPSGQQVTSGDGEKKLKIESHITPLQTEIFLKKVGTRAITLESITGTFDVGDTISKGASPDIASALIYGVNGNVIYIGTTTLTGSATEFAAGDGITTANNATATISASPGVPASETDQFVFSTTTSGGVYSMKIFAADPLELFADREYRFNVEDSSMAGTAFRLSSTENGEWGPDGLAPTDPADAGDAGVEYSVYLTVTGTAGSSGAYLDYAFQDDASVPTQLYWYDTDLTTATKAAFGGDQAYFTTTSTPTFTQIRIYDVEGTWVNASDTFIYDGVTYTVSAQDSGPYGYVRDYTSTTLKVIKGIGSADFAGTDTFLDAPYDSTANRATVTVSSVDVATAALEAEHYIIVGKSLSANTVDKTTSLVIGPGERVVVNSVTQNNVFSLIGFEDLSTAFTTRIYS